MISKWIYKVGEYLRNKKINIHFQDLMKSDKFNTEMLKALQEKRLRLLLKHAKTSSKYYQGVLKDIDVETFALEDIKQLPILSKQTLLENSQYIQNDIKGKMFKSSTSGSTGNSLRFERNLDWDASHRAAQLRGYQWYGIKPWMKNLYFWGYNPSWKTFLKIRLFDALLNRYRIFNFKDESTDKLQKYIAKSQYIEGYSSSIYNLAKYLEERNLAFDNLVMIKGTSEKIFDYYQKSIQAVFGKKMVSEYGAAETGIIAFECPSGKMHVTMENVIVETVDEKIVVTNLFSYSFPIIRYELGDYIKLNTVSNCTCGRAHDIIDEVTGRIGQQIIGKSGEYPSLTLYYVFKNLGQEKNVDLAYSACQSVKGKLHLRVLAHGLDSEKIKQYIDDEIKKYFKGDLDVFIKFVTSLENDGRKSQSFESFLDKNNKKQCAQQ